MRFGGLQADAPSVRVGSKRRGGRCQESCRQTGFRHRFRFSVAAQAGERPPEQGRFRLDSPPDAAISLLRATSASPRGPVEPAGADAALAVLVEVAAHPEAQFAHPKRAKSVVRIGSEEMFEALS
jgi:hypothetical protein